MIDETAETIESMQIKNDILMEMCETYSLMIAIMDKDRTLSLQAAKRRAREIVLKQKSN